jgi:hypothetical protein
LPEVNKCSSQKAINLGWYTHLVTARTIGLYTTEFGKIGVLPVGLIIDGPNVSGPNLCEDIN